VERAESRAAADGLFGGEGLGASCFSVEMDEGGELGLEGGDAIEVRLDEFRWGKVLVTISFADFCDGRVRE